MKALSYLGKVGVLRGVAEVSKHCYSLEVLFDVRYLFFLTTYTGISTEKKGQMPVFSG